ncbi:MAG: hypothetical protein NTW25_01670, partial [Candidatus Kapabacteria bacterium]|nr:hypothetical protein [Candidatus Kapabacteria bacterium]
MVQLQLHLIIYISKTANDIILSQPIKMTGYVRFLNDAVIDVKTYDVTLGPSVLFYTTLGTIQSFSGNRCIHQSLGLTGGKVIQEYSQGNTIVSNLLPIGTPGTPNRVYSEAIIKFINNNNVFQANAKVSVQAVSGEHPAVESAGTSLKKYWKITPQNITEATEGMSLNFTYEASDVGITSDASYKPLWYYPQYPDVQGFWRVGPGTFGSEVNPNTRTIVMDGLNSVNGDWTAGEASAAIATYYSRANGNYNDPNSWSKTSFNGAAAANAPLKQSDIVLINSKTITV